MCIICVEWAAGKLTSKEALKNLGELISSDDDLKSHYWEASEKILDKEVPVGDSDLELDKRWHDETHEE